MQRLRADPLSCEHRQGDHKKNEALRQHDQLEALIYDPVGGYGHAALHRLARLTVEPRLLGAREDVGAVR
jgi:hypothetical protein